MTQIKNTLLAFVTLMNCLADARSNREVDLFNGFEVESRALNFFYDEILYNESIFDSFSKELAMDFFGSDLFPYIFDNNTKCFISRHIEGNTTTIPDFDDSYISKYVETSRTRKNNPYKCRIKLIEKEVYLRKKCQRPAVFLQIRKHTKVSEFSLVDILVTNCVSEKIGEGIIFMIVLHNKTVVGWTVANSASF